MKRIAPIGAGIIAAVLITVIAISTGHTPDTVIASTSESATPSPTPFLPLDPLAPQTPHDGGMDAMSIDMDPHAGPANTATSISSREFCARINENDLLDADEVDIDTLEIDVMTGPDGIPSWNAMIAFEFELRYEATQIRVVSSDSQMLLATGPNSSILNVSDAVPDEDGRFYSAVADFNASLADNVPESGPGVLSRLRIESTPNSRSDVHHLFLDRTYHINLNNAASLPNAVNHGIVAINVDCPANQPAPSIPPTPPPTPTPSVTPPPLTAIGGMDAMAIDMNPTGVPANTATSIGSREFCGRINENDLLDADEDDIDTLEIDITTGPQGIPTGSALLAFEFALLYSPEDLVVSSSDPYFILSEAPGSELFDASVDLPNSNGKFIASVADLTEGTEESGPGTLARIRITTTGSTSTGIFDLTIRDAGYISAFDKAWRPDQYLNAFVAIDTECPSVPPPPVINVTPTPVPPTPAPIQPLFTPRPTTVIRIDSLTLAPGESASANVWILPGPVLSRAFAIHVHYDSDVVTAIGCTSIHPGLISCDEEFAPGAVRVSGSTDNRFEGAIVQTIFLVGPREGDSRIDLDVERITAQTGEPIPHNTKDGTIHVLGEVVAQDLPTTSPPPCISCAPGPNS